MTKIESDHAYTPRAPLRNYIKRYTSISTVVDILRNKQLVLVDPQLWDDKNDRYFMALHKEKRSAGGLYAMCCTRMQESYQHWRSFTGTSDGACIEITRGRLERAFSDIGGLRYGTVDYVDLKRIRKLDQCDADSLPFMKRIGFESERVPRHSRK